MMIWSRRIGAVTLVLGLAACGGAAQQDAAVPPEVDAKVAPPKNFYQLANGCFIARADDRYVRSDGDGFTTAASSAATAERFYMKPATLGRYLFHTAGAELLTAHADGSITAAAAPSDGADWTFADLGRGVFTASTGGQALAVAADGRLVHGATAAALKFERSAGCTPYPEMPTGIAGDTFKGHSRQRNVIGFAEVHAHMAMGDEMSDGTKRVGPSAGGTMYGHAADRFGVVEALKDCEAMHGKDGRTSPENVVLDGDPLAHHDTVGWPTFVDWPERESFLHQQMYYKWVERAYKAGLRTMVVHGTNIEALCDVAKKTGGNRDGMPMDEECRDMEVGLAQVHYLYDIERYVDAQEGGPGKGWFRVVRDPSEARAVIADGKLAVIPGLEFSNIFHCNVIYNPDGTETHGCTKQQIDEEIDAAWDAGVRAVFPFHDVDSALGGAGIFGSALNLINFYGTRGWWKTYPCENGGEGPTYFYEAGAVMESSNFTRFQDPITQALIASTGGVLPLYGPGRQCNARDVTPLGEYAIRRIMAKGFTIDIDHAEIRSKQTMLGWAAEPTPNYPMISGHGGHGGINVEQVKQIVRQGGIVYPALPNGEGYVAHLNKLKPLWLASGTTRPLAIGYGADANGLRKLPGPRGADRTPIRYPFTLFQGPGWGPQFADAGVKPLKVEMLSIPGGKSWDMNEQGMEHYGLVADIVEEIRLEGGEEATTALYNSAEAYLQLWEQTLAAAAAVRANP